MNATKHTATLPGQHPNRRTKMPDILVQAEALVLLQSGVTIMADVLLVGDTREHYVCRDTDLIRVRPSNWGGADWTELRS